MTGPGKTKTVGETLDFLYRAYTEEGFLQRALADGADEDEIIGANAPAPRTSPTCATCIGRGTLGAPGHEIPCPACDDGRPPCATCKNRRTLGAPGHEIPCPQCKAPARPPPRIACATCSSTGKLGAPPHEVRCPLCNPTGE